MAQDAKIMAAAWRRFQADRERRREELERRTAEVYRRLPRVESIDRELRGTVAAIMVSAFERDADPESALQALEHRNLALQRERAEAALKEAGMTITEVDKALWVEAAQPVYEKYKDIYDQDLIARINALK